MRVVLGVTGASGAAIAYRVAEIVSALEHVELHLVASPAAAVTCGHELGCDALGQMIAMADKYYRHDDIGGRIASGSFRTDGMIVAPCSMNTLAAVAAGFASNLLARAADVHLKERRRLVLIARETPLHLGHLRNMVSVTEMGAVVMPPVPGFYRCPATVAEIVDHIATRAIDQLHLTDRPLANEWGESIMVSETRSDFSGTRHACDPIADPTVGDAQCS